jgi:hypothetical protein
MTIKIRFFIIPGTKDIQCTFLNCCKSLGIQITNNPLLREMILSRNDFNLILLAKKDSFFFVKWPQYDYYDLWIEKPNEFIRSRMEEFL